MMVVLLLLLLLRLLLLSRRGIKLFFVLALCSRILAPPRANVQLLKCADAARRGLPHSISPRLLLTFVSVQNGFSRMLFFPIRNAAHALYENNSCYTFFLQLLDWAMFTFEERFNEGISGTDAMTNGETAADVMKVVKEEVLMVTCIVWSFHYHECIKKKFQTPFWNKIFLTVISRT